MLVFLARRFATFLITLVVASAVVFAVLELLPGNAAEVILGDTATPESLAVLQAKLGLDRPAPERYAQWVGGLLRGETARSISYDTPTAELIAERLQVTLPLWMPGVATGCMLVFILLMGEYLIPALLGGGKVFFIGNALVDLFLQSRNWPFGSAVAVSLVAIMLITVTLYLRLTLNRRGFRDQSMV